MTPLSAFQDLVPEVLGPALGLVLSVVSTLGIIKSKVAALEEKARERREEERELGKDLKDSLRAIQGLATDVKVVVAEQAVINKVTTNTLDGICKKLDVHDHDIAEIKQQLILIREITTGPCRPGKPCWNPGDK